MQIRWRKNPKTEDGWFKRTAISLLAGLGALMLSLPVSFALFLQHLSHISPNDPQNFLGAITSAVLVGLALAAVCFAGAMMLFLLFSFQGKRVSS